MESLYSLASFFAAYWWLGLIIVALFLGVRRNIPMWFGIVFSAVVFLFFSTYALPFGLRSAIQSLLHAFLDLFR
jgi:hypothetical protein